jgi:hypothetical protein
MRNYHRATCVMFLVVVFTAPTTATADVLVRPRTHDPPVHVQAHSVTARKHTQECMKHISSVGVTLCHYDID